MSLSSGPAKPGSVSSRPATLPAPKTAVLISVYDLLPPSALSDFLWTIGAGLLHSGVVVGDREYAFGGHHRPGVTGVYWTSPHLEPPGGTFRAAVLRGHTSRTEKETESIIKDVSDRFLGTSYNLLTFNCNHFTSALCKALLGRSAPAWLNRAARAGRAFPCFVPRDWIAAPEFETAGGELLDEEDEEEEEDGEENDDYVESRFGRGGDDAGVIRGECLAGGKRIVFTTTAEALPPARIVRSKDTSGRDLPAAERAPVPKKF
ncbi:DUF862-domain-containing protein [Dissoconium aciculare CBS 342.82]|uniref:DUF862-domain-containing protein n=1 Tax=Dissoconium aciculare CBS 342.82 TaxID=1314786 RepID=A0A6J3MF07_9PEZI|nr:DUF862-domain-containing protein [Dissoconium aciculare CBS 342.82]KAF1826438.1 DUF862-domain-containing protein [Dissoconium aciculare CBS 342.82]